jgi:hypothetical protein
MCNFDPAATSDLSWRRLGELATSFAIGAAFSA